MKKRIIALLLAGIMICTLLPVCAFAATEIKSGYCGDDLKWSLDSEGTLTISGTGDMNRFSEKHPGNYIAPWDEYRDDIKTVIIEEGATRIGSRAFEDCENLKSVTIPDSVTRIMYGAFDDCDSLKDVYYYNNTNHCSSANKVKWSSIKIEAANTDLTRAKIVYGHVFENGVCTECGAEDKPDVPTVKISLSASSVKPKLTWSKSDGAVKYEVYRALSKNGKYSKLYTTTKTSFTNTSAKEGTAYYYKVKAVSEYGIKSEYSNIVCVPSKCAAPVVKISTSAVSGKPTLKWDAVPFASQYVIYRAQSKDGSYSKMYTTSKTSYTNTSAKTGYTYYYKVKAISDFCKDGTLSAVKSITCDCARPAVKISISSGNPKLSWEKVDGAVKYEVYRTSVIFGGSINYKKLYTTTKTSFTNTSAEAGVAYSYKVIAVCGRTSYGNSAYSLPVYAGNDGSIFWTINSSMTLTISGKGAMRDYDGFFETAERGKKLICAPWGNLPIKKAVIKSGVTNVGSFSFPYCDALESVTIADSVKKIDDYAFYKCSGLENVKMGNGVTSIGIYAFSGCGELESVTIPVSVTKIGSSAFSGCSELEDVYYSGKGADKAKWSSIDLGSDNEYLINADIHYVK